MNDTRYNFFIQKPGERPIWCSTRTNRTGTMHDWIRDLEKRYRVVKHPNTDNTYVLIPR